MAAVLVFSSFFNASREPKSRSMACARGPLGLSLPPAPEEGARLDQKRVWFMWPASTISFQIGKAIMNGKRQKQEGAHTPAIELERRLEFYLLLHGRALGVLLLGGVEPRDIRLVVLRVVEGHDLLRDVRLEGVVCVRQRR